MRLLTAALVSLAVIATACNGSDAKTSPNNLNGNAPNATVPVATADSADAGRPPTEPRPALERHAEIQASAANAPDGSERAAAARSWREVTIPAGTSLPLVLDTGVGSDISRVEQPVRAHLARSIAVHGQTVVAAGSPLGGVVTDARRSGKVKGLAHVAVRFDTLTPSGSDERYRIHTTAIGRTAPATKKKDALKIGAPAAGGAIIGGIIGGKKGAAIGTAAGGGAGTAVVMSTRGKEVHLAKGSALTVRLAEPVTVRVKS
jgi:hypothetical protein